MGDLLKDKVAIVTGAGRLRGIGRATAVALAKLGADVVVTGTGRDPATFPEDEKSIGWCDIDSVSDQIRAEGQRALPLIVDVINRSDIQRMVDSSPIGIRTFQCGDQMIQLFAKSVTHVFSHVERIDRTKPLFVNKRPFDQLRLLGTQLV